MIAMPMINAMRRAGEPDNRDCASNHPNAMPSVTSVHANSRSNPRTILDKPSANAPNAANNNASVVIVCNPILRMSQFRKSIMRVLSTPRRARGVWQSRGRAV